MSIVTNAIIMDDSEQIKIFIWPTKSAKIKFQRWSMWILFYSISEVRFMNRNPYS